MAIAGGAASDEPKLSNLMRESRKIPPPVELAAAANVAADAYGQAVAAGPRFWATAAERLSWAS